MKKRIMNHLVASSMALGLVAIAVPADAGRGGNLSTLTSAAGASSPGAPDAIVAELERTEKLICARCIPLVMDLIDSPDYAIAEAAAWWFAKRPRQRKELRERSVAHLEVGDSLQVRSAAIVLGAFRNPAAAKYLVDAQLRGDLEVDARFEIARALGSIGHIAGNEGLEALMQDSNADVRVQALISWTKVRQQLDGLPAIALLSDTDHRVRQQAAAVLAAFPTEDARSSLEGMLDDPNPAVVRNALFALKRLGTASSRQLILNLDLINHPSPLVRGYARAAL